MKVSVYDTYVKAKHGDFLHFDILVPESNTDLNLIHSYGNAYLDSINESDAVLSTEECQFCHVEEPGEEVLSSIESKGYFILEMDSIPAKLPDNPTRRDMILHLRAHSAKHRFASFRGIDEEAIKRLIGEL